MSAPNVFFPPEFRGIGLPEGIEIDSKLYFTKKSIGQFLGYSDPQRGIDTLLRRNMGINQFSLITKCHITKILHGKKYTAVIKYRVFNLVGFCLIAMESYQPKSIDIKIAYAKFASKIMYGDISKSDDQPTTKQKASIFKWIIGKFKSSVRVFSRWLRKLRQEKGI